MLIPVDRDATISACGRYRIRLVRRWGPGPLLLVVMFNPSLADASVDDPTITLLMHIAQHNGYGGFVVFNLCPLRSSSMPAAFEMLDRAQVDGDVDLRKVLWDNLGALVQELESEDVKAALLAWGAMGWRAGSWYDVVMQELRMRADRRPVFHLGKCANGHPKHPMARGKHKVPKDAKLIPWRFE
jgi:hypothetical protein